MTYKFIDLDYSQVEAEEGILKFRCGRSDIEDLAFGCRTGRIGKDQQADLS